MIIKYFAFAILYLVFFGLLWHFSLFVGKSCSSSCLLGNKVMVLLNFTKVEKLILGNRWSFAGAIKAFIFLSTTMFKYRAGSLIIISWLPLAHCTCQVVCHSVHNNRLVDSNLLPHFQGNKITKTVYKLSHYSLRRFKASNWMHKNQSYEQVLC